MIVFQVIKDRPSLADGTRLGIRAYRTDADRKRAIKMLARGGEVNSFVTFLEVCPEAKAKGEQCAVMYGWAAWPKGRIYVQ